MCEGLNSSISTKYELQDGRMIKEWFYRNDILRESRTFSYDSFGNITKLLGYDDIPYELISYDNKKGIFSGINKPDWLWWKFIEPLGSHTVNNPIETISTNHFENQTTVYEYEYNSSDYPTKIKVNGLAEIEIKYIEVNKN